LLAGQNGDLILQRDHRSTASTKSKKTSPFAKNPGCGGKKRSKDDTPVDQE